MGTKLGSLKRPMDDDETVFEAPPQKKVAIVIDTSSVERSSPRLKAVTSSSSSSNAANVTKMAAGGYTVNPHGPPIRGIAPPNLLGQIQNNPMLNKFKNNDISPGYNKSHNDKLQVVDSMNANRKLKNPDATDLDDFNN